METLLRKEGVWNAIIDDKPGETETTKLQEWIESDEKARAM